MGIGKPGCHRTSLRPWRVASLVVLFAASSAPAGPFIADQRFQLCLQGANCSGPTSVTLTGVVFALSYQAMQPTGNCMPSMPQAYSQFTLQATNQGPTPVAVYIINAVSYTSGQGGVGTSSSGTIGQLGLGASGSFTWYSDCDDGSATGAGFQVNIQPGGAASQKSNGPTITLSATKPAQPPPKKPASTATDAVSDGNQNKAPPPPAPTSGTSACKPGYHACVGFDGRTGCCWTQTHAAATPPPPNASPQAASNAASSGSGARLEAQRAEQAQQEQQEQRRQQQAREAERRRQEQQAQDRQAADLRAKGAAQNAQAHAYDDKAQQDLDTGTGDATQDALQAQLHRIQATGDESAARRHERAAAVAPAAPRAERVSNATGGVRRVLDSLEEDRQRREAADDDAREDINRRWAEVHRHQEEEDAREAADAAATADRRAQYLATSAPLEQAHQEERQRLWREQHAAEAPKDEAQWTPWYRLKGADGRELDDLDIAYAFGAQQPGGDYAVQWQLRNRGAKAVHLNYELNYACQSACQSGSHRFTLDLPAGGTALGGSQTLHQILGAKVLSMKRPHP